MTTLFIFVAGVLGTLSGGSSSYHDEFHQTYALEAHGRVVLENINGDVHITAWDRNEVKVDAAKSAWSQERLDDAHIVVDSHGGVISIKTRYPGQGDSEHPARPSSATTRAAAIEERLMPSTPRRPRPPAPPAP